MDRRSFLVAGAAALASPRAKAQESVPIRFDADWRPLTFPRRAATRYGLGGRVLTIEADASSSLIYLPAPEAARGARRARWSWTVAASVPPTDLSRKGGDDRNLSVYFVFMEANAAARLSPDVSPRRLLGDRSARALIYVWGGDQAPGRLTESPYMGGRGVTVALRPAGTGQGEVDVDHARAFGSPAGALVGLAVSADSDDTETELRASLSDLVLN